MLRLCQTLECFIFSLSFLRESSQERTLNTHETGMWTVMFSSWLWKIEKKKTSSVKYLSYHVEWIACAMCKDAFVCFLRDCDLRRRMYSSNLAKMNARFWNFNNVVDCTEKCTTNLFRDVEQKQMLRNFHIHRLFL